ncbi:MAG: NTP transferase domain-containing protein [Saprospiraceae bacterium]
MKHQKHATLSKPTFGQYHAHEWGILGAKCSTIEQFVNRIVTHFPQYRMGYLDASHRSGDQPLDVAHSLSHGLHLKVTDHMHYRNWEDATELNDYDWRIKLRELQLLWINSNHFPANRQIILIDPEKEHSIIKRKERITRIDLILKTSRDARVFEVLRAHPAFDPRIPVHDLEDEGAWLPVVERLLDSTIPAISGLLLVGGRSTRMGTDKAQLSYHGQPQQKYLYALLKNHLDKVYFSVRQDQQLDGPVVRDAFAGLGPFGAILSFFQQYPDHALLSVACDLPGVDHEALAYLIKNRDPARLATAFLNPETGFADPLFTIWEPRIYQRMLQFLAMGYSCPRKVLINSDIKLLEAPNPQWLANVNTPEELKNFKLKLGHGVTD